MSLPSTLLFKTKRRYFVNVSETHRQEKRGRSCRGRYIARQKTKSPLSSSSLRRSRVHSYAILFLIYVIKIGPLPYYTISIGGTWSKSPSTTSMDTSFYRVFYSPLVFEERVQKTLGELLIPTDTIFYLGGTFRPSGKSPLSTIYNSHSLLNLPDFPRLITIAPDGSPRNKHPTWSHFRSLRILTSLRSLLEDDKASGKMTFNIRT